MTTMERPTARTAGVAPVVISGGPTFSQPTTLAGIFEALASGARIVAGGTDLVVGTRQGKWSMPDDLVAIDRSRSCAASARPPTAASGSAR